MLSNNLRYYELDFTPTFGTKLKEIKMDKDSLTGSCISCFERDVGNDYYAMYGIKMSENSDGVYHTKKYQILGQIRGFICNKCAKKITARRRILGLILLAVAFAHITPFSFFFYEDVFNFLSDIDPTISILVLLILIGLVWLSFMFGGKFLLTSKRTLMEEIVIKKNHGIYLQVYKNILKMWTSEGYKELLEKDREYRKYHSSSD